MAPDAALLRLVPADTILLAGARPAEIRKSKLYERYGSSGQVAKWKGLPGGIAKDSLEDVREMLVSYNGADALVLSRGKFTENSLAKEGTGRSTYKGHTLIGDDSGAVVLLDDTTAAAGSPARLRALIDGTASKGGPPTALLEIVKTIDSSNQIWMAARGGWNGKVASGSRILAPIGRILRKVDSMKAGCKVSDGVLVEAQGECATAEDAETLQSGLRAMIGFLRLGLSKKPELRNLLDTITVSRREHLVEIHAEVPPELAGNLLFAPAAAGE